MSFARWEHHANWASALMDEPALRLTY